MPNFNLDPALKPAPEKKPERQGRDDVPSKGGGGLLAVLLLLFLGGAAVVRRKK